MLESSILYTNVLENVLCDPLATQETLDSAMADLDLVATELDNRDVMRAIRNATDSDMEAALAAYEKLAENVRDIFDRIYPEATEKLHNAAAAAKAVEDQIAALGDPDQLTLAQSKAVQAARKAYEALTDAEKTLVSSDSLKKLEQAEARLEALGKASPTQSRPSVSVQAAEEKKSAPNTTFTDVPSGSWYAAAVKYAAEKGLMTGTSANCFSPDATTTRGMIVTILARVEGVDTSGNPWYAAGRKWAMDNGISDGTDMTGEITREQLAAILYRYAKFKGYDTSRSNSLDSYRDADKISSWALEAMQWANAESLITGKSNNLLDPQGKATRAETAAILMRFMQSIVK